jgi:hypothetical protein
VSRSARAAIGVTATELGTFAALGQVTASKTANYAAAAGDTVLADASGGTFTVTLPAAAVGARVAVKKTDASTNSVIVANPDTSVLSQVAEQNQVGQFVSFDGSTWTRLAPAMNSVGPVNLVTQLATDISASSGAPNYALLGENQFSTFGNDLVIVSGGGAADIAIRRRSGGTGVLYIDLPVKLSSGKNLTVQDHSNTVLFTLSESTGLLTVATTGGLSFANTSGPASTIGSNSSTRLDLQGGTGGVRFVDSAFANVNALLADNGDLTVRKGVGFWGHAAVAAQPAAPVTLTDVIAIIRGCGLSA